MMIRNFLILTVLAALVPTAMSNVSAPADAEIALFSGVSDSDGLSISGNGDTAKMELKATNDNGKSNRVLGFLLTAHNVLTAEVGDKVTVKDNVDFTKAVTTDARNNQKAIGITSNGVIDFAGYNQGVYTLDVVVDDDRAYEAIIVIGGQTHESVKSVNKEIVFKIYNGNNTGGNNTGGGIGNITGGDNGGGSNMTENSNFAGGGGSNMTENSNFAGGGGDSDSNMTQGITEFATVPEEPEPIPVDCNLYPEHADCLEPEPIPVVNCYEGWYADASGTCQPVDPENPIMPTCEENPNQPDCEMPTEEFPTEEIDCELQPELCEENFVIPLEETEEEELPEEEELTEEIETEEIETEEIETEDIEEESEEDESGESEDEVQDEDSGEESEGESEEESGGDN
jgi:hypothetical protein